MTINYSIRKKVDKTKEEVKELYYAVPKAVQGREGIDEKRLAEDIQDQSSLMAGDVLSALQQLPNIIAHHIKNGRTVTIHGLGTFYPALSSEGFETPEECTPNKVKLTRVCFRADKKFTNTVRNCDFHSFHLDALRKKTK
ncbi:HU family DNA-binding protein [Bacteroides sp.]